MKGNSELIAALNDLLASEITAINQYTLHAEMCEDWGYTQLHASLTQRSLTEMKHAEHLIERILFLEGQPIVSQINNLHIGKNVAQQIDNDHNAELNAIHDYNEAIILAAGVPDYVTRDMLADILCDEDRHVDDLEALQIQIEQMSLEVFLSTQI